MTKDICMKRELYFVRPVQSLVISFNIERGVSQYTGKYLLEEVSYVVNLKVTRYFSYLSNNLIK